MSTPDHVCLICETRFASIGGGHYPFRPVRAWADALICNKCRDRNWDGVVLGQWPLLEAYSAKSGISRVENAKGWWEIPQ